MVRRSELPSVRKRAKDKETSMCQGKSKHVRLRFAQIAGRVGSPLLLLTFLLALGGAERLYGSGTLEQVDVYTSGQGDYHTYRIPAVVRTRQNTLLAFCEGRKTSARDHGDVDIVLRRSLDAGRTWTEKQLVHEEGGTAQITIGNPAPVVDRRTGTIYLALTRNNDRVFIMHSTDDGQTWKGPVEITDDVKKPNWTWYATGPGHGIQLRSGRLLIPCDHAVRAPTRNLREVGHSHVIYSDDHGKSWRLGGVSAEGMNECEAVELADGSVLLSMRNYYGRNQRAFALSRDGGLSWSEPKHHPQIYCPTCQASILRYSLAAEDGNNRILYSGPGGPGRRNLTIRMSEDEGRTWPVAKVLYAGSSAYSDLVLLPDGKVGCLYERDNYGKITFARFDIEWLEAGNGLP